MYASITCVLIYRMDRRWIENIVALEYVLCSISKRSFSSALGWLIIFLLPDWIMYVLHLELLPEKQALKKEVVAP